MSSEHITIIEPLKHAISGSISVPGDKSISHRAVLFSAMAEGTSNLKGVLDSDDVKSSIAAVCALGADVKLEKTANGSLEGSIKGWGDNGPKQPDSPIDCGNSGTTARLLMGILAPWPIEVTITGDDSLKRRPMRRNSAPLMKMGVQFKPAEADHLPITEKGTKKLRAITYDAPMASAQLKTAVLLAGAYADGETILNEPSPSRNHTELMLPEFGVPTTAGTRFASVVGPHILKACDINVPGDPSSAAFLCAAAVLKPLSSLTIKNVSLNSARIGFVRTLERMGANISEHIEGYEGKEPHGSIHVEYTANLRGCEIPAQHFASIIDEVPVLAFVAAHAKGLTVFRDSKELRTKETDRIQAIIEGLSLMGVDAWEESGDLYVEGSPNLQLKPNTLFDSHNDHRMAMTWALAGLCGSAPVQILNFDCISVSYPDFIRDIEGLAK